MDPPMQPSTMGRKLGFSSAAATRSLSLTCLLTAGARNPRKWLSTRKRGRQGRGREGRRKGGKRSEGAYFLPRSSACPW